MINNTFILLSKIIEIQNIFFKIKFDISQNVCLPYYEKQPKFEPEHNLRFKNLIQNSEIDISIFFISLSF